MKTVGPAPASATSSTPRPKEPGAGVHVVRSGDTLSGIADDHHVSVKDLLAANPNIKDPDVLNIGEEVHLPAARPPAKPPAPPAVDATPAARPAAKPPRQETVQKLPTGATRPTASPAPAAPSLAEVRGGAVAR